MRAFLFVVFVACAAALLRESQARNLSSVSKQANSTCLGTPVVTGPVGSAQLYPLSNAKNCYGSIRVDTDTMLEEIDSVFGTLDAFYVFWNLAKNPPDSSPAGTHLFSPAYLTK